MAGIRKKGDAYYCTFRFQGRRSYFTVGEVTESQAKAKGVEVDETLDLIERGRLPCLKVFRLKTSLRLAEKFRRLPSDQRSSPSDNSSTSTSARTLTALSRRIPSVRPAAISTADPHLG
jgi:hypothetical protein